MEALIAKKNDFIGKCLTAASEILKLSITRIWIDYDKEADVLYMSFRKPQRAAETVEFADNVLIRKDGKEIVG